MIDSGTIHVKFSVSSTGDAESLESELSSAEATDVDVDPDGVGIVDPITAAVVGTIVVGAVIQVAHFVAFLGNWWRNRNKPGLIIDAREETIKIIESTSVPAGQIVSFTKAGETVTHTDADGAGLEDYVPKVLDTSNAAGAAEGGGEEAGVDAGAGDGKQQPS